MKNTFLILPLVMLISCQSHAQNQLKTTNQGAFNRYWFGGKAELTSYELEQARYGEIHEGTAVMVFVTEPFSKSKQVKLDNAQSAGTDAISVLKLNFSKKFLTGIYPYSMMTSTFSPVTFDQRLGAMKVTTSSQEWCGHTFMQLNQKNAGYDLTGFSYFETEGDISKTVETTLLEDEIWTIIRMNPSKLPIGDVELLPGTFYLRLRHQESSPQTANASLVELAASEFSEEPHHRYSLEYKDRKLTIYFESKFPYGILGWEESHLSGFGNPKNLTTIARRKETLKSPYWSKHRNTDRDLRKKLGL